MSIKTLFTDIATAIKEKNTDIVTVTPSGMPQAIRDIETGGGVPLYTANEWSSLTTEEKQALELVAIQETETGFERGKLVYGADYLAFGWNNIIQIHIIGTSRSSGYTQLGGMRFKNTNNEYAPSQANNIASATTKYGYFIENNTQGPYALLDNSTATKIISAASNPSFEWVVNLTDPFDISGYDTIEIWTAGDDISFSGRQPVGQFTIIFYDGIYYATYTIENIDLPISNLTLGYSDDNFKNSAIVA